MNVSCPPCQPPKSSDAIQWVTLIVSVVIFVLQSLSSGLQAFLKRGYLADIVRLKVPQSGKSRHQRVAAGVEDVKQQVQQLARTVETVSASISSNTSSNPPTP